MIILIKATGILNKMIIYLITNIVNGKLYVGQTRAPLKVRWSQHVYAKNKPTPLVKAIAKYGLENFEIKEIAKASSLEELNAMEIQKIKELNSLVPNGYNIRLGGCRSAVSEETRKKISESRIGPKHHFYGKKLSEEHRKKLSESRKGRNMSEETKLKISMAHKGSKSHKWGKPQSEETKAKRSRALKGRVFSTEHLAKIKEASSHRFVKIQCVETGEIFESTTTAAKKLNIQQSNLWKHLNGLRKKVGNLTFRKI